MPLCVDPRADSPRLLWHRSAIPCRPLKHYTVSHTVAESGEFTVSLVPLFSATGSNPLHNAKALYSGGEWGIRTPDTAFGPYNGLANRRLQPLGQLSVRRDKVSKSFVLLRSKNWCALEDSNHRPSDS